MIKYTNTYLSKLEDILKEAGYKIRYEKGNFKSGFCVLEETKVIVVNKFVSIETKINFLIEILKSASIDESLLNEKSKSIYYEAKQIELKL